MKIFNTAEYNKCLSDILDVKTKQKELVNKSDIDKNLELLDLAKEVAQISVYDFLLGRMYFTGNDGYQNFLVFAPILTLI